MESLNLRERVQELTDLELALLLSLVASQNCIIQAELDDLEPLEQELRLVRSSMLMIALAENFPTDCFKYLRPVPYCDSLRSVSLPRRLQ